MSLYNSLEWQRVTRKCSLCGEIKPESEFRYMNRQKRYNAYCKKCESWYNKLYKKAYRERKRDENGKDLNANPGRG